ncbi:MAG TPA: ParB/RepB/Spo0J family partition protein [Anaerolineales bacterium]|nr:ParB/RepB/Spo0J family partition protein [Anaerolineales bacterium]
MVKKSGLGKGLDALLPAADYHLLESGVRQIQTSKISPNPRQPRANFDAGELDQLATSIREHGVIQPLIITAGESAGSYTLIAGERRLMAAKLVELEEVPAIIREASDQELVELALVENVQRADLGPLETAEAYRQLSEDFGLSHEEIAARVGKNRATITNTLRLIKLPEDVKEALVSGKISEGHARALLSLPSEEAQGAVLKSILKLTLNVRQTEELVRKLSGEKPQKQLPAAPDPEIKALEEQLRQRLGTKVSLNQRSKGGTLTIHYYSAEELDTLLEMILGE